MSVSARSRKRQVQRLQAARKPSPFASLDYLKGYARRAVTDAEVGRVENMHMNVDPAFGIDATVTYHFLSGDVNALHVENGDRRFMVIK